MKFGMQNLSEQPYRSSFLDVHGFRLLKRCSSMCLYVCWGLKHREGAQHYSQGLNHVKKKVCWLGKHKNARLVRLKTQFIRDGFSSSITRQTAAVLRSIPSVNRNLSCPFEFFGLSFLIRLPSLPVGETLHRRKTMLTADTADDNSPWQNKWQWGGNVAWARQMHEAEWARTWWSRVKEVSRCQKPASNFQSRLKGLKRKNFFS